MVEHRHQRREEDDGRQHVEREERAHLRQVGRGLERPGEGRILPRRRGADRDVLHALGVDARATEHDLVVYNNATLMPMQAHYSERADIPYTTIPAYTTFVTDETLAALATTTAQRIWFVNPPPQYPGDDELQVRATLDEQFFVAHPI